MTLLPDARIIRDYVSIWSDFLDTLASEGGHIVLWSCGIGFGFFCTWMGYDILDDRISASAMTGLGIALKVAHSNAQRKQEMGTTTVATAMATETIPAVVPSGTTPPSTS